MPLPTIQNVIGWANRERIGHLDGCLEPASVELIIGCELREARSMRIGAVLDERVKEPRAQLAAAVVRGYARCARHS